MKHLSRAALLLAFSAAACNGDSPTQKKAQVVARVYVTPSDPSLNVGDTVRLAAQGRDDENLVVPNTTFTWSTLDPGVAGVSTTGLVTAAGSGTARVVAAAANGVSDTALVTVAAVAAECTPGSGPQLAVGQSVVLAGTEAALLCLEGQASGAEYVVMPFHATSVQNATVSVRLSPTGVDPVAGPPLPSLAPSLAMSGAPAGTRGASMARDGGFHTRLNARSRDFLSGLVPGARATQRARSQGPRMSMQQQAPTVGTLLQLNVSTQSDAQGNPCTITDYRTGRVVAVSNRAVIVADTANPAGGFTAADYENVAATFDTLIHEVNAQTFGEPHDIDQNARSIIFYTRAVNELTPANVNYVVGGFFYGRDLFPRVATGGMPACAGSNAAEMFYMLAPDPTGVVNGNVRSTAYVRNSTLGVVGHEYQHLISASRRLYLVEGVSGTSWNEETFLNEGLSHIAEELLFYRRAGLGPRMNLGGALVDQPAAASAFNEFQRANHARFGLYLQNPDGDSPYDTFGQGDDLATRGAAWGFLRWAADQRAGDDQALWFGLVNNPLVGLANLQQAFGQDPVDLARRFSAALYTDDAVPGVPVELTHPSWNFRSLYTRLNNAYPLEVSSLVSGTPSNVSLVAGGTAYLRAGVKPNQRASVQVTSAGAAPPATVRVTVVRTK